MTDTAAETESTPRFLTRARRAEVLTLAGLVAWLAVVFLPTWNPWWVPTGDSEVFLVVARNLFNGNGLQFNGHDVAFIPPGWPLMLAGLFHLTDSVLWLKLFQIVCMSGFLLLSYAILRHFVSRKVAAFSVAGASILTPLYPLTFWLHSDAFFCLISAVTGLIAVRWGNGRLGMWALAIVAIGCSVGVIVRWAAVAQVVVWMALACGSGRTQGTGWGLQRVRWWPHLAPRHWLGAAVAMIATFGTFVALAMALGAGSGTGFEGRGPASQSVATGTLPMVTAVAEVGRVPEEGQVPSLLNAQRDETMTLGQMLWRRFVSIPQWASWTLFQPLRITMLGAAGVTFDRGVGLLALALLGLAAWKGVHRRQWLFLAVGVYIVGLAMNWPLVNNRYVVPVTPFLIAGVLQGLWHVETWRRGRWVGAGLRKLFLVALLAANLPLWAIDVWVSRAPTAEDFYARYEAGIYQSLIDVSAYLGQQPDLREGNVAASLRYENLKQRWEYKTSPRVVLLFTGVPVEHAPKLLTGAGVRKAQAWARENGIEYFVQQNPTVPGRVWHFRVTAEVHERITGNKVYQEAPQFELFTMQADPIPTNPDLYSLKYHPVPAIRGEELEAMTRRVPLLRD